MRTFENLKALKACVGEEVGVSPWVEIDQERIDLFARATGDHNWIHVDPERAANGPFGKTIAHGFLTLSLLPLLVNEALTVNETKLGLNYGMNKVRFPQPVKVGSRLRGRIKLLAMDDVEPIEGNPGYQITYQVTIESDEGGKPACIAENVQRKYG